MLKAIVEGLNMFEILLHILKMLAKQDVLMSPSTSLAKTWGSYACKRACMTVTHKNTRHIMQDLPVTCPGIACLGGLLPAEANNTPMTHKHHHHHSVN